MAHVFDTAPTGRAKCRGCARTIAKGELRFGERLPNPFAEDGGEMTHWYHPICAAYRRPEAILETLDTIVPPVDGHDRLKAAAAEGIAHRRLPRVHTTGKATTGRATCGACREPIEKDSWRIGLVFYEDGRFNASGFIHLRCAATYFETTALMDRIRHFSPDLSPADLDEIQAGLTA